MKKEHQDFIDRKAVGLLPTWYDCIPDELAIAALDGSELAREVCKLIEFSFHKGWKSGKDGNSDPTDIRRFEAVATICCNIIAGSKGGGSISRILRAYSNPNIKRLRT
jgi:hypothetical protein